MNLVRLNELKNEVGQWSAANFGDNSMGRFKALRPALGVLEEYFEWCDAVFAMDTEGEIDALADIGIYLLDFCYQLEIDIPDYSIISKVSHTKLPRILLKRIQEIRGYENTDYFIEQIKGCVADWFVFIDRMADDHGKTGLEVIEEVWQKVVSKRNWVANKENGQ